MSLTVLTKEIWENFTEEQRGDYRDRLFMTRRTTQDPWPYADGAEGYPTALLSYYRVVGFPFYEPMTTEEQTKKFKSLLNFDHSNVYREGNVHQTMHGLGLVWTYFPHMWGIQCNNMKTAVDVFKDDKLFLKAIDKRLKWGTYISDGGMRKALRSFTGTQTVSNFRPSAAATIYHNFLPAEGGVTWDMSSGFGGRLLGAMACGRVRKYIGTDPSSLTFEGLKGIESELLPLLYKIQPSRPPLEVELHKCGSEDYKPEPDSIDLCFTSSPYFNCEKYSEELTQSYIRYPTKEEWLHGFMRQTLNNCHYGLRKDGHLILNIAGVKTYPTLHVDLVSMAESCGWLLVREDKLLLSRMMGTRTATSSKFKDEPLFIFRKK